MIQKILRQIYRYIKNMSASIKTLIQVSIFVKKKTIKSKCLLVTSGGLTGAPIVLFETALLYQKNGYEVIIACEECSPLRKMSKEHEILFLEMPYLKKNIRKKLYLFNFKFVFVNTVSLFEWTIWASSSGIPTLWWIHEGYPFIRPLKEKLPAEIPENVYVLTGGERPRKSFLENGFNYPSEVMYYGVTDLMSKTISCEEGVRENRDVMVFSIMGTICKRKNQISVVDMYEKMNKDLKSKIKLIFVGNGTEKEKDYFAEFKMKISQDNSIIHIPFVKRCNIPNYYQNVDAVICCSIDDPLPVVVTEGLMFGKIVIVSSETGQYPIIENGINGFKYDVASEEALEESIKNAYQNRKSSTIKQNARKTYETYFSSGAFEKRLMCNTKKLLERSKHLES